MITDSERYSDERPGIDKVISLITSALPEAAERLGKAIAPANK